MKKQTLIDKLIEVRNIEEGATAIYYEHLDSLSSRFLTDSEFAKKAKEYFTFLIEGNNKHKRICESIIEQLKKDERDDY